LQQEDFYHAKVTGYFDETTKQAVQQFQLFHNLDTDGKVGQQTREWLNASFQAKADMIAQALRLCRQSQTRRFQKFVWINIPQFTLEYRNEGKVEAVHRVIVGKASGKKIKFNGRLIGENQTPALASTIEEVVINPRWYVTDRIRLELSDEIAADPSYLTRNGYVQMTSARYPWGEPRLIQLPGPNNALGRVRFDFPNAYAVYMHDTPNKYLFQRARRDLSHGCIRVEKAHELARELLADDQNPAASKIEAYLATNRETFLRLHEPVPIIIEYVPVVVNPKGDLVFCGDPYGLFPENSDRKS
jgi:murein L,D-transpeptidase YcbB/YkuD